MYVANIHSSILQLVVQYIVVFLKPHLPGFSSVVRLHSIELQAQRWLDILDLKPFISMNKVSLDVVGP